MDNSLTSHMSLPELNKIEALNRWILEIIGPYIKGRTLEINSGTNSLCPLFTEYNRPIHLSDKNPFSVEKLRNSYNSNQNVRAVHELDLIGIDFQQTHAEMREVFDTVIAFNVSIGNFGQMAENIKYILPKKGSLAIILPAYTSVYDGFEQNLDAWKRYNGKSIKQILDYNFSFLKVRFFNLLPETAVFFSGTVGLSSLVVAQKL